MLFNSFKNHFLIAMPGLEDPNFQQAVTYICEHHQNGAMGIVVNHPLKLTMKELFGHLNMDVHESIEEDPLMYGGPVKKERGFVLHTSDKQWENTLAIAEGISLTGSRDILADIAKDNGPQHAMIALGYSGWDAGQLEAEIAANTWLTVPADKQILFHTDYSQRWKSAARKLGIDLNLMTSQQGHA
ncbi:MAG: YqgE/AlgH family protein [Pseudomonadota bacterium]